MFKGVIFDMDGLMFDSESIGGKCLEKAGKVYGYDINDEIRFKLIGRNAEDNRKILKQYFGEDFPNDEISKLSKQYRNDYYRTHGIPLKKGLMELLEYLSLHHIPMAVASSTNYDEVIDYLKMTHIDHYINYVIGGNQVSKSKPEPEIFLKSCERLNLEPEDCLVLEDSKYGIIAASRAHIPVICVPDLIKHDQQTLALTYKTVESLLDVIDVLKEIDD